MEGLLNQYVSLVHEAVAKVCVAENPKGALFFGGGWSTFWISLKMKNSIQKKPPYGKIDPKRAFFGKIVSKFYEQELSQKC